MARIDWTDVQQRRLIELDVADEDLTRQFNRSAERDRAFQELEKMLVQHQRRLLTEFQNVHLRPRLNSLENRLVELLCKNGFAQVTTPIIMSKGHLAKMSISDDHPLQQQIYWIEHNRCLRPMLAPHLYFVLKDLLRLWEKPVRIFEVGPCFRKESQGLQHTGEFTMLNLVEMGLPAEARGSRIEEMAALVMEAAGIGEYALEKTTSEVYGDSIDILGGPEQVELASSAMGPHPLDQAWRINDTWIGIGFGLERILMVREQSRNLSRWAKSLTYLDGIRLNI